MKNKYLIFGLAAFLFLAGGLFYHIKQSQALVRYTNTLPPPVNVNCGGQTGWCQACGNIDWGLKYGGELVNGSCVRYVVSGTTDRCHDLCLYRSYIVQGSQLGNYCSTDGSGNPVVACTFPLGLQNVCEIEYTNLAELWPMWTEEYYCGANASDSTPDFSLGASPLTRFVTQGESTEYTVSVGSLGTFNGTVNLSANCPAGSTCSFENGSSVTLAAGQTVTKRYLVTTSTNTAFGNYPINFVGNYSGVYGNLSHSYGVNLAVSLGLDGAMCENITVNPEPVTPGQPFSATVRIKNTGTSYWTTGGANPYRLRLVGDNYSFWSTSAQNLPSSSIAPGASATFNISATAPSTVGTYNFSWQIVHEGVAWVSSGCTKTVAVSMCPAGDVTLGASSIGIGGNTTASAPAGWTGGTFSSSNNGIASIPNNSANPATINGIAQGTASISGSGWNAPGGYTNCPLNSKPLVVSDNTAACGSATQVTHTTIPVNNLCFRGTLDASGVTGTGPWTWTCRNGTSTASCQANPVTTNPVSCPTPTGSVSLSGSSINVGDGTVTASVSAGYNSCTYSSSFTQVASVGPLSGIVTPIMGGSTSITASCTHASGATGCGLIGANLVVKDFAISPSANPNPISAGQSSTITVNITSINGANMPVTVTPPGGLPSGWSISPASRNSTAGSSVDFTLTTTPSAWQGTHNMVFTGTYNGTQQVVTRTGNFNMIVGAGVACPAGSVTLGPSSIPVGGTSALTAPAGWSGGSFSSSSTTVATVDNLSNPKVANGVSAGTTSITGTGWSAPNGAVSCPLSGATLTVSVNKSVNLECQDDLGAWQNSSCDVTAGSTRAVRWTSTGGLTSCVLTNNENASSFSGGANNANYGVTLGSVSRRYTINCNNGQAVDNVDFNIVTAGACIFNPSPVRVGENTTYTINNPTNYTCSGLPANSYYSTVSGNTIKALTGSLSPVTPAQVSISCTHNINGTPGGFICDVPILDYEVRNAWSDNAYFDPNLGVNVGKVVRGGSTTITVDMNAHQDWGSNPIQVVPQASLPSGWTITPSSQYWYPSSGSNWIVFTVTWASDANWGTGSANGSTNIDFFARYLDRTRGPKTVSFYDGGLSMMCDYVNENSTKKVCTVNSGDSTNLGYVVMAPGITTCTTTSVPAGFNHSTPWGGGGWAEHYEGFTSGAITQNMVYTTTCQTAGGPLTDSVTVNLSGPPSGGPGGFSVVLTPASQTIQQGAAISDYTVTITSVDGFAGTVSLSVPAGKCPVAAGNCSLTIPSVTLTGGQVHNTGRLRISNSSSISPATYDLQVDGVSGTKSASGTAQLVVQGSNGPTGFGGGNGTCGKVTLTWNSHASASGYYVYRNQTGNSPSVAERVKTINSGATTTWTDPDSGTLTPGIYFYWISWYNGTQESAKTPLGSASISATSCDANLSSSDKDIVQVNGVLNTTSDCATPGQTPTGATYKVGDEVKFSINICNTGGSDATSVTVVDTLTNMAQPTGGWQAKLDGVNINPTVTGSEPTQTLTFNVGTVAAGASKKLTFTAKITPPVNFTGTTARFQNTANINYVKNGGGQTAVKTVVTPLLIFTRSNNPSIIEVAP